jgi:hypothetical protein
MRAPGSFDNKENNRSFTLSRLGNACGPRPRPGRLGAWKQVDDGSDIIDWVISRRAGELARFHPNLAISAGRGESLAAIEQAMHEHNTVALVIPAHTLKGDCASSAPPLAAVAEKSRRPLVTASNRTAFPTSLSPTWLSFAGCGTARRAVRQGHQPAAEPHASRRRVRQEGRQPGI